MERIRHLIRPLLVVLLAATSLHADGVLDSDILNQVPRDALAIAVVRNISQADARMGKLLSAIGSRLPGPLAFLRSLAGLDAGLDTRRDLMIALMPSANSSRQFHLAVWLPVKDYDALVRSLDGDPQRRIAAVTLAGEDLLVVRQNDWAVIMDTDQRDRLEQLREGDSSPPQQLEQWTDWMATNDATIVALPAGMRTVRSMAAAVGLFDAMKPLAPAATNDDDLFGSANGVAPVGGSWPAILRWLQTTFAETPELANWFAKAQGAAIGLRLDDEVNVLAGMRLAIAPNGLPPVASAIEVTEDHFLPHLYDGGPFIVVGSGQVSPRWAVPAVGPYVRQVANELASQFGSRVDEANVASFRQAAEQAVADVRGFSVFTRPGADADGVYTNSFLALRVADSGAFLETCSGLIKQWNAMVGKTEGSKILMLDSLPIKLAGREGTEYSIDLVAALADPAIPEIKASIEKQFSPDGKLRLHFVEIDDRTVLLALATEAQVTDAIAKIDSEAKPAGDLAELSDTAKLFRSTGQWQVYVSPHGYTDWKRRELDAILGAVIGGPLVPQFPQSPSVGFAGGVDGPVIWAEFAVPVETLRGYGRFSTK